MKGARGSRSAEGPALGLRAGSAGRFACAAARAVGFLLAGAAPFAALGCGGQPAALEPAPPRDLALLELMIKMQALHRGMEPVLRSEERLPELAEAARGIASLAAAPLFAGWTRRPDFLRDPGRFEAFRLHLLDSAEAAAAAAEAGDKEALHRFYAQMDGSCVACHKRYLETY